MERRSLLQMLCVGIGAVTCMPAHATPTFFAPVSSGKDPRSASQPAVATEKDVENAQVEDAQYGHWRRVNRRHYRRVSRRVYRRHYYY